MKKDLDVRYFYPVRRTFKQHIVNEKGQILFTLAYEQATMGQYFAFNALSIEQQNQTIIDEIVSQIPYKWYEKIIKKIFPNFLPIWAKEVDFAKLAEWMIIKKFRVHNSIFSEIFSRKNKTNKGSKNETPFASTLTLVCEKCSISPVDVMEKLTLEQFMFLQDGLVYNNNELDDEGKKENAFVMRKNPNDKDFKKRLEETRKFFEE